MEVNNMSNRLTKKIKIETIITATSGLHIGGSNLSMAIGGADAVVIRDPITQQPIIPGSSIKGKMRSLTERILGAYEEGKMGAIRSVPFTAKSKNDLEFKGTDIIPLLYGRASGNENNVPSRLIVRDAHLTADSLLKLEKAEGTDMLYTEVKTEVVIDRVTSAAMPRQLERVPAGSDFASIFILNVFENDDESMLIDYIKVGLKLMEDDYLGGKGSRGSGTIKVAEPSFYEKTWQNYLKNEDWKEIETKQ